MITAHAVEVRVGARVLLEAASFRIGPGDRVGLVGRNGAGKTTLFRLIANEISPESGSISVPRQTRIGRVERGSGAFLSSTSGETDLSRAGYDHFEKRP